MKSSAYTRLKSFPFLIQNMRRYFISIFKYRLNLYFRSVFNSPQHPIKYQFVWFASWFFFDWHKQHLFLWQTTYTHTHTQTHTWNLLRLNTVLCWLFLSWNKCGVHESAHKTTKTTKRWYGSYHCAASPPFCKQFNVCDTNVKIIHTFRPREEKARKKCVLFICVLPSRCGF